MINDLQLLKKARAERMLEKQKNPKYWIPEEYGRKYPAPGGWSVLCYDPEGTYFIAVPGTENLTIRSRK